MADLLEQLKAALADRYDIEHEIGRGGMATVYLARDIRHDREVAVKLLRPELAVVIGAERFLHEIRVTARLQHPHILPLFDSGQAGGFLYYVMPLAEGETLADCLRREKELPIDEAVRITTQVAQALDYAHRHDIVHRDIKPSNILFHDGQALVSDFGVALAIAEAGGERITATGMSVGTPEYMSPEQATAERELDARSDVYSLACVLYEMLAGEPPYTGPNARAVIAKRFTHPVPSVRRLRDAVPESIDRALMKAMAKVPADRCASAVAFAEALTQPTDVRSEPQSVAVLPFVNMSADPENEFFSDGITEDIIAQLSKIGALKVISRTSVMRFKNREQSLKEIGETLGVGTILEGSVRRAGNRVRIVAQLINVETDVHLWAETYDRELTDIFTIQSDVALQIAGALETELTADEQARIEKDPTHDLVAYQLYLKGRHCVARFTQDGLRQGIVYFEQAVDRDPEYALAYASMAFSYVALGMGHGTGEVRPDEGYSRAKAAAAKALEIDSELGDAYASLAFPMFVHEFDWDGAEAALRRALELRPNAADTLDIYGLLLAAQERYDEAIAAHRRAQELDPLIAWHTSSLASTLLRAGRYTEALLEIERVVVLEPHFPMGHSTLGWAYLKNDMHDKGIQELEQAVSVSPENTIFLAQLGQGYATVGRVDEARAILRQLQALSRERYVAPYHMAYVYTGLGENDNALDALEQAYEERAGGIYGIKGSFLFATLREHPRFKALLGKLNLD